MKTIYNPFSLRNNHSLTTFETVGQFMEFLGTANTYDQKNISGPFFSNETFSSVAFKAVNGDKEASERADKLLAAIETGTMTTTKTKRVNSYKGRPSVARYLSGNPKACKSTVKLATPLAPITVVVSLNSMASVETTALERRGVAIAALVKKLSRTRTVTLYLSRFSSCPPANDSAMLVKFPTAPLDSYRLAFLLSNQGFCRGAGFIFHGNTDLITGGKKGRLQHCSFAGGNGYSQSRHCQYATDLTAHFGTQVFYIEGSDPANSSFKQLQADPVAWVNDTVKSLSN